MATDENVTPEQYAQMTKFGTALYETRLANTSGEAPGDEQRMFAAMWASSCIAEAIAVLEITHGHGNAERMVRAMMDANAAYSGPRLKRMRN